jgi:MarR family
VSPKKARAKSSVEVQLPTYPRERALLEMDRRPVNAGKGWKSIFSEDVRVMAAWIYFSWCYPARSEYAVDLNLDETDVRREPFFGGGPKVMTQAALARILGMSQQNVNRATKRLVARKLLVVGSDGEVYPVAKPEPFTEAERCVIVYGLPPESTLMRATRTRIGE